MRLRSAVEELVVEVQVDPRVGRDMVIMAVGTWMKRGGGVNILTEDIMSNFGEMAAYGETRVLLEPLEPPLSATPCAQDAPQAGIQDQRRVSPFEGVSGAVTRRPCDKAERTGCRPEIERRTLNPAHHQILQNGLQ